MGIEGLPSSSNPFSRIDKTEIQKQKTEAAQSTGKSGKAKQTESASLNQPDKAAEAAAKEAVNTENAKKIEENSEKRQQKAAHHLAELQAMTEQIQRSNQQHQTRNEILSMANSLMEMNKELTEASNDRYGQSMDIENSYTKLSYWDKLDVVSKSKMINQLKEDINDVEIERSQLIRGLKEQVSEGTYQTSGAAILKGMIDEYF